MEKERLLKNEDRLICRDLTEKDVQKDKEKLIKKFESLGYEIDQSNIKLVEIGRPPLGRVYLVNEKDEGELYVICAGCYNDIGIMRKDWMKRMTPQYITSIFWYGAYYGASWGQAPIMPKKGEDPLYCWHPVNRRD
jgi:hypothetical protein